MDQVIKIDINLVFTIINLLVLYLLMKKFLFGPIINVMDQRKAMIDQQFAEAKERQDNAKVLQEQYEGALKSAKEESYQIMEQARKEAKAQADHTVEETTAKVDAMLAKAQEDIRMERENAMRQLRSILYDKELQHRMAEQAKVEAGKMKIEWGSQIRSYVFDDRRVKDHRTNYQTSDVNGVMDGKIDGFIKAYLMEFSSQES